MNPHALTPEMKASGMYARCRFVCDRCRRVRMSWCYKRPVHDARFRGPCDPGYGAPDYRGCSGYGTWTQFLSLEVGNVG